MGVWYSVVNETKREWLDAGDLGLNFKDGRLNGLFAVAVARLMCKNDCWIDTLLDGAWSGDTVSMVYDGGDEGSLSSVAASEYEDVSYKAIAVLADDEEKAEFIVRSMWPAPEYTVPTLLKAIEAAHPRHKKNLQEPAEAFFGPGWESRSREEWGAWSFRAAERLREEARAEETGTDPEGRSA